MCVCEEREDRKFCFRTRNGSLVSCITLFLIQFLLPVHGSELNRKKYTHLPSICNHYFFLSSFLLPLSLSLILNRNRRKEESLALFLLSSSSPFPSFFFQKFSILFSPSFSFASPSQSRLKNVSKTLL